MAHDLGSFGPTPAAAARPARRVRLPRVHPLVLAVLVLLGADGLALAGRAHAGSAVSADPAQVAVAFLDAVGDGHGATARAYLQQIPAGESRLTDADLAAQVGPAFVRVSTVVRHGDRADVTATYDLVGVPATSYLHLADDHGGLLGASRWHVVGGLPVLVVRGRTVEVDGRPVLAAGGAVAVTMFPGLAPVDGEPVPVTGDRVVVGDVG